MFFHFLDGFNRRPGVPRSTCWLLLATAFVTVLLLSACEPASVAAPSKLVPYTATDKSFKCNRPDSWDNQDGGNNGMNSFARFRQRSAFVEISTDLQGSLMADITRASNAQTENLSGMLPEGMQSAMPKTVPPVEKLHMMDKNLLRGKYKNYEEDPMKNIQSGLGEGRISEWTGELKSFPWTKFHGYRVTMLSGERRVQVVCRNTVDDWKTLSPSFAKIVQSLGPGE